MTEIDKDFRIAILEEAFRKTYNALEFYENVQVNFVGHDGPIERKIALEVRNEFKDLADTIMENQ